MICKGFGHELKVGTDLLRFLLFKKGVRFDLYYRLIASKFSNIWFCGIIKFESDFFNSMAPLAQILSRPLGHKDRKKVQR